MVVIHTKQFQIVLIKVMKYLLKTVEKAKKEGGDDIQILYLTHIGTLYTATN